MPDKHALLGPSSSKRWIECTPSARLTETMENGESDFAKEGTLAHSYCEYKLNNAVGREMYEPFKTEFYSQEIEDCSDEYCNYVIGIYEEEKQKGNDPYLLVEQEVKLDKWVQDSFGTCDALIVSNHKLYIIDYKHGKGVLVDAEHNTQMMLYSLGALDLFDALYDIEEISMTIFQPRLNNVSTFEMKKDELLSWAEDVLKPRAEMAFKGIGEYHCGEWCRFCLARNTCRERARANMELAKYDFKKPPLLEDDEIEEILDKIEPLVTFANDIKDYALAQAIEGKRWKNYKVVEGRSTRKYTDESSVAKAVIDAGFDPYEKKVKGITDMQKHLGKARFEELLNGFITRNQGKPTLVNRSDKRPELVLNSAQQDFNENNDNMEEI